MAARRAYPETALHIAVARFLTLAMPPDACIWWHTPNGGKRGAREASELKAMGTKAGVPDLLFLGPYARLYAIELKAPKGRVTQKQADMLLAMSRLGARTAICRTLTEVESTLRDWGLPLRAKAM